MNTTPTLPKAHKLIYGLSLIAVFGMGTATYLTQHFYSIRSGNAGFKSVCNMGATMNCDVVAASPHAELFGLPLSSFAAGSFLALLLLSLLALRERWRSEMLWAALGISTFGTLVAIPYLFIMALQLKTLCLFCLVIDGLNLSALLLLLHSRAKGTWLIRPFQISSVKLIIPIIIGSVLGALVGLKSFDMLTHLRFDTTLIGNEVLHQPQIQMPPSDNLLSIGPHTAPITIVEYSDFECPFCRLAAFSLNAVINRYPGKIRVIFKNYPLNSECNADVQQTPHPNACTAARAAFCAQRQGKFEEIYQSLFENQNALAREQILNRAQSLGLNSAQLKDCMDSADSTAAMIKDVQEAGLLGVISTPTFFINGHKMEGAYPVPSWIVVIEKLLEEGAVSPGSTHDPHR